MDIIHNWIRNNVRKKVMYDARGDQLGVLGARWSPAPPCWSCHCYRGLRTQRLTTTKSCAMCLAHWRSARRQYCCDSVNVIKMAQSCNRIGIRLLLSFLRDIHGKPTHTIERGVATGGGATAGSCAKKLTKF